MRLTAQPLTLLLNCRTLKLIGAGNPLYCSVSITVQKALQKLNSPISLAGFAYFGTSTIHSLSQLSITLAVSTGSIALILTWYFLTKTWYVYQGIAFYRMREIEEELGLCHYRYTLFIRLREQKEHPDILKMKETVDNKLQNLDKHISGFPRLGINVTTKIITFVFILGWVLIIIRELFLISLK